MREQFNGKHKEHQPPDGAEEYLEIAEPVMFDADVVVVDEHHQRHYEVDREVCGRRDKAGNKAQEVREEDEKEYPDELWIVATPFSQSKTSSLL